MRVTKMEANGRHGETDASESDYEKKKSTLPKTSLVQNAIESFQQRLVDEKNRE